MDEYGELLDVGTELADIPDGDMYISDAVMDEISGDALNVNEPMDVSVDYSEQESFDQFLINEAEENGLIEDSFGNSELEEILSKPPDKPVISEDDYNLALEILPEEYSSKFQNAVEQGNIMLELDEFPVEPSSGPVRIRRR